VNTETRTSALNPPNLGPDGEPCASCGMPLAADQRYCLECGRRRGGAPPPFQAVSGEPPPPPAPPDPWYMRGRVPAGLAAAAVLLLALGLGVLIGSLGDDSPAPAQQVAARPQVITVQTAGGGAPVAQFTSDWPSGTDGYTVQLQTLPKDGTDLAAVTAAKQAATGKGATEVGALDSDEYDSLDSGNYVIYAGVFTSRKQAAKSLKKVKGRFPGATVVKVSSGGAGSSEVFSGKKKKEATVGRGALKDLQNSKGGDYNKKSAKLPDTTKLPGKAPPKDSKQPGGGSDQGAIEIK
jgi:hypothetical protein